MQAISVNTKDHLVKYGIRPSVQRLAIMEFLLNNRTHPTPEQVYSALSDEIPTLSRTTVYNTLTLFAQKGAALHINLDPRGARYDGDTSLHGHFLCSVCGELHDVFYKTTIEIPQPEEHLAQQALVFYKGICKNCLKTNNKNINQ